MTVPPTAMPRIPTALLGATGLVGQRFVELLAAPPRFELVHVAASARTAGQRYGDAVSWRGSAPLPSASADLIVAQAEDPVDAPLVLSALDTSVAGPLESACVANGSCVVTNASPHRLDSDVPLVVPEVNPEHLDWLPSGCAGLAANPNCSTIGLALALAPLERAFGVVRSHVVTLQALSGAGLAGVASLDAVDNVLPWIAGEEEKLEAETRKIFGTRDAPHAQLVSAQCNRVPVIDGHLLSVSVELQRPATHDELVRAWNEFRSQPQELGLPSAPEHPTLHLSEENAPQPRRHRDLGRGMTVSIGRLRRCPIASWRFVALVHNTVRGAAGGALLLAELIDARGRFA